MAFCAISGVDEFSSGVKANRTSLIAAMSFKVASLMSIASQKSRPYNAMPLEDAGINPAEHHSCDY
jgi:hypothetical protein